MSSEMKQSQYGSTEYRLGFEGLERRALLHVPSSYDGGGAVPLIVALHGKAQPAAEFEDHTQLSVPDVNNEAIVVYPEGVDLIWLGDPESPTRDQRDDVSFIVYLLDKLQQDYKVDKIRVYCCGFSNGGGLTDLLAADPKASVHFAAFAMSSAALYRNPALRKPLFENIKPGYTPIPILEFHGDADPVIHYDGKSTPDGETFALMTFFETWAHVNGCRDDPSKEELYQGKVVRYAWWKDSRDDKNSEEVLVHYFIHGFGHGWPTKRLLNNDDYQRYGPTPFDATPVVLEWFNRFKLHT